MRPLTIKQILDAEEPYPEAGHQVDKVTISHVGVLLTALQHVHNILILPDYVCWPNSEHQHTDYQHYLQS